MHRQIPIFGILLMCAGVSFFGLKDGFGKMLVRDFDPVQIAWFQFLFSWIFIAPIVVYRNGFGSLWPRPFLLPVLRGLCSCTVGVLVMVALQYIPLADTHAIVFVAPIIVTALSPWLLKEAVGVKRWSAVIVGFIGVLIILRPDFSGERFGYLVALSAGLVLAFYFIVNRKAANLMPPEVSVLHAVAVGAVLLAVPSFYGWTQPKVAHFDLIGAMALFTVLGHLFIIQAFKHGQASLISPFQYSVIIVVTIFGYVVFGDIPEPLTWLGIAIVIASGVYIAIREGRLKEET